MGPVGADGGGPGQGLDLEYITPFTRTAWASLSRPAVASTATGVQELVVTGEEVGQRAGGGVNQQTRRWWCCYRRVRALGYGP